MLAITKFKTMLMILAGCTLLAVVYFIFFRAKRTPLFRGKRAHFEVSTKEVKKVILSNGMTVLMFKTTSTPKVLVQIAYDIGSYVEDSRERGLAHLIEHMIFKGTDKLSEVDIDHIARKYGATFNAFTSMDITSYYFETDKNNWKPFVTLLADCMQNARFEQQHLASEIKAVIQELRMRKDNYWSMMLDKAMQIIFPANYPYHFPVIGYKEELLNLSAENLKSFYKKYYQPKHATLFIVGDFDQDEAIALAKKEFENITNEGVKVYPTFPALLPEAVCHQTRMYEDVQREQLGFYWVIPGLKAGQDIIATLTEFVLGDGEGSRLYKLLVDQKKVASSLYVKAFQFMEAGIFLILIEPIGGKSSECRTLITQELSNLIKSGATEAELERSILNKGRVFFERLQSYQEFTYVWLQSYFATRNELDVFDKVNRYSNVKSIDIQNFCSTYLDPFFINQIDVLPLPKDRLEVHEKIKKLSDDLDKKILSKHTRTLPLEKPAYANTLTDPEKIQFSFPKPDRELTLANGLKVLLCKHGNIPLIGIECLFRDSDYLTASRNGVKVHLMMDNLMEGSREYKKEDNVSFFEDHGASYRFDSSGAGLLLLNDDYEVILKHFLHVLSNPTFPTEALDKIKAIFIDSIERSKDVPFSIMERELKRVIYQDKDYGWTFDEAIALVKNINRVDLCKLHTQFVCPNNMVLAIVGAFDLDDMQATVEKIFGAWPAGSAVVTTYPKQQFTPCKQIDKYMLRDQAILTLCQPSFLTIYDDNLIPVRILNIIAFKDMGSRLYALREQTGIFYRGFGTFAAAASKEPGFDYVGALLSLDKMDEAENMLRDVIKKVADSGINEQELACARQIYLKSVIDCTTSISSLASTFTLLSTLNLDFDYYDKVLQRTQSITVVELNKIAKQYFTADRMARIRIGRVKIDNQKESNQPTSA
jgi:zinc protease